MTLRELRKSKGITQTFISCKLGYANTSGYNNIELGRVRPSLEHAKVIADIFELSIEEVFFKEELQETCKGGD